MKLDDRGRPIDDNIEELAKAENVLIVDPMEAPATINRASTDGSETEAEEKK